MFRIKKFKLILSSTLFILIVGPLSSQEICNNGIDDDANGLVDTQDPICVSCYSLTYDEIEEDFEDFNCCPTAISQTSCINGGWIAVTGTPDYFHTCGLLSPFIYSVPLPIPSGEGCIGMAGSESMGFCLEDGIVAGQTYEISFFVGYNDVGLFQSTLNAELSLYGTSDCTNLSGVDDLCSNISWYELTTFSIVSSTQNNWVEFSGTFTPTNGATAIAIVHNGCSGLIGHFIDKFEIKGDFGILLNEIPEITFDGNCMDGYFLTSDVNNASFYQWYLDEDVIGGSSWNSFQLDPGQSGMFQVSVLDNAGCNLISDPIFVEVASNDIDITPDFQDLICQFDSTTIALSVNGGELPYLFYWEDGSTSDSLFNVGVGSYSVTVTDNIGCTAESTIEVDTLPTIIPSFVTTLSDCNGAFDGSIDLSIDGGLMPYTYQWSNDSLTEDLIGLAQGTYFVTITDNNNCVALDSIVVNQEPNIEVSASISNINCPDLLDGSIYLDILGDPESFDVEWNTASDSNYISSLSPGSYTVTVTAENGCTWNDSYVLIQNSNLSITAEVVNDLCYLGQEGSIDVQIENSNSPYTILWNNGSSEEDLFGISAGQYEFSLVDSFGCAYNYIYDVDQGLDIEYTTSQVEPGCNGASDGSIQILPIGGSFPLSYNWNNEVTDAQNSNIQAGVYYITITDNVGCTKLDTFLLSENSILEVSESIVHNSCHGDSQGQISIDITGSMAPYTVIWNTSSTLPTITDLSAGEYTATITDAIGCETNRMYTVDQPDSLGIIEEIELPSCHDDFGTISILGFGGSEPYSILWSTGDVSTLINIEPGNKYEVTLTDINNCFETLNFSVAPILEIDIALVSVTDTGPTNNTGEITIEVSGGTPPYQIVWDDGQVGTIASGLGYGAHMLDVIDANGCLSQLTIDIDYSPMTLQSSSVHNLCFGDCNGMAVLNVGGGILPYDIIWSDGQMSASATDLCAGTYQATIIDATGSEIITDEFIIQEPTQINIDGQVFDITCVGSDDGRIEVNASGGVTPYAYAWSNGMTGREINNVSPGTYQVTVTDENDCTDSYSFTLEDIPLAYFEVYPEDFNCNETTTRIKILEDNFHNYPIYINDAPAVLDESGYINNLSPGNYVLAYKINETCMILIEELEIINPNEIQLSLSFESADLTYGDMQELTLEITSEPLPTGFTIDWNVANAYECTETYPEGQCKTILITAKVDEEVEVTFTDARGCITDLSAKLKVDKTTYVHVPNVFSPNGDGINDVFEIKSNFSDMIVHQLIIYDRWGNEVFTQKNKQLSDLTPWDGMFQNREAIEGVYMYLYSVTTIGGDSITNAGDITIIR